MTLSEFVKNKRKEYNLTQVGLARETGVGLRFVRDLEQGKSTLRMDKVNQVLALFGSSLGPGFSGLDPLDKQIKAMADKWTPPPEDPLNLMQGDDITDPHDIVRIG